MKVVGESGGLGITSELVSNELESEVCMTKEVMIELRVMIERANTTPSKPTPSRIQQF